LSQKRSNADPAAVGALSNDRYLVGDKVGRLVLISCHFSKTGHLQSIGKTEIGSLPGSEIPSSITKLLVGVLCLNSYSKSFFYLAFGISSLDVGGIVIVFFSQTIVNRKLESKAHLVFVSSRFGSSYLLVIIPSNPKDRRMQVSMRFQNLGPIQDFLVMPNKKNFSSKNLNIKHQPRVW